MTLLHRALVFCAVLAAGPLHAQQKRFAVLEFTGEGWKPAELAILSDTARGGALSALPQDAYLVMTRESTLTLLRQQGLPECTEGECEVDTLQNLGADMGMTGKVVNIDGTMILTLKLFDARSGGLLAQEDAEATTKKDLIKQAKDTARKVCEILAHPTIIVEPP